MKHVSLFDFMPYGAPELLVAGRRHLAQALLFASLGAASLYAIAAILMPRSLVAPGVPHPVIDLIPIIPPRLFMEPATSQARAPHVAPAAAKDGPIVPVEDVAAPADVPAGGLTRIGPVGDATADPTKDPPVDVAEGPLPRFDQRFTVDRMPEAMKIVEPNYPEIARAAGVEGLVVVRALVGKDGSVLEASVDPAYTVPLLDAAALDAARRWGFTPAQRGGRPVPVWTAIPFRFTLH